jgi:hypothetical protein
MRRTTLHLHHMRQPKAGHADVAARVAIDELPCADRRPTVGLASGPACDCACLKALNQAL